MTPAYDEKYLDDAMRNLGEAFDYAVNACGIEPDRFAELFVASGYADLFGKGNPKIVSGLSGTELVMEVVWKSGLKMDFPEAQVEYDCSPEYWCGWILAYYQWRSGCRFRDILNGLPVSEIYKLYVLHEASEEKFVGTANEILAKRRDVTKLQKQRKLCGYSQRELAERAGVNLRTLQQYELGTKEMSKAAVSTVMALANVLGCRVDDLTD